jgi:hypothetical protein
MTAIVRLPQPLTPWAREFIERLARKHEKEDYEREQREVRTTPRRTAEIVTPRQAP